MEFEGLGEPEADLNWVLQNQNINILINQSFAMSLICAVHDITKGTSIFAGSFNASVFTVKDRLKPKSSFP